MNAITALGIYMLVGLVLHKFSSYKMKEGIETGVEIFGRERAEEIIEAHDSNKGVFVGMFINPIVYIDILFKRLTN